MFVSVFKFCLSFFPAPVPAIILGMIGLFVLFAVFKIIGMVLNAIPFL